ncbi:MAG: DUF4404 family protein [Gammaproteobacteria bacterium]|nr:DUF4404 family protein [Gammaproteobacteria bacterium]MCP4879400.1 DUF4404 family protein [Gammaproteobacteria bacterium]
MLKIPTLSWSSIMETSQLQKLLLQLHQELSDHQIDDAQVQAQLQILLKDIDRQIHNKVEDAAANSQLSDLAIELEAEFPRLSSTLREVTDQLSKLGI